MVTHISLANSSKIKSTGFIVLREAELNTLAECNGFHKTLSDRHYYFLHLMNDKTELKWNDIDFLASWA